MITTLQVGSLRGKGPGPPSWLSDRSGSRIQELCVCVFPPPRPRFFPSSTSSSLSLLSSSIVVRHHRLKFPLLFLFLVFRSCIIAVPACQCRTWCFPSSFPSHLLPSHSFVPFPFFMLSVRSPKPQMLIPLHLFIVNKSPSSHGLETHSRIVIAGL